MNYRYTKIINDPNFVAPIRSSEPNIRKCWNDSYQALNMIAWLYRADAMYRAVYSPYLNVYRDMCYYQMLIWWGGVVVVLDVMAVQGNAETPVLPVPVVAGDALVALAVPVDAGQPATAGAHNHAHQAAATRRGLEV